MTVLGTIIARLVGIVRGFAMAEIVAQVIIWRSFYLASPWLLWGPAAALAWGGATIAYLRRGRPGRSLVCADTAVYTMLAFGAAWCVPAAIRGEAASWLFIVVVTQSVAPVWFAPRALAIPLAVMPGIALAAGTAASAPALVAAGPRRASLVLVFVVAAMHWLVQRTLRARAVAADAGLAAAHREARDHYVVLSENFERREQDRPLHDTILNTLTAIAGSGGTTAAISQCRQDIALLERALSESGDAGGTGPVAAIETVAREMRARGLAVDVEITGGAVAAGTPEPGLVPGPVVAAVAHATREALANVAAHAGTGRAWVTVSVMPPGSASESPGIQVIVRDEGTGFDPGAMGPARLGVRRSITERVEDWGGSACSRSPPGWCRGPGPAG